MFLFFTAQTEDANSLEFDWRGGVAELYVGGGFGGGTLTFQAKHPAIDEWIPVQGGEWTEPEVRRIEVDGPCKVRFVLADATASTVTAGV